MTDRVSSGSERLDAVLGGGLLANSINIVMGASRLKIPLFINRSA